MLSHGIPPMIVAGMLGHSLVILMTTYAHYIPETQDEAARVMDDILTPIPINLRDLGWAATDLSEICRITHETGCQGDFL